jgi:spermidine/putrescine transport system permease protein
MRWRDLPAALYLAAAAVFIFLPVVVLVQFSFQDGLLPVPPFRGFSLRWYERLFADRRLMQALGNSAIVGALSALAATILGFLAAYSLARRPTRWTPQLRFLLMAPITVSYIVIALGLLIVFNGTGLGKSLFAVGIGHAVINLPLGFAVIYSQMGVHQLNLERAALDLGASEAKALLYVTVPVLWPALLAAFFIAFTLSWDEFVIAQLLSKFDVTMPVVIFSLLRTGLNPVTNAVGTFVFVVSVGLVVLVELLLMRRPRDG